MKLKRSIIYTIIAFIVGFVSLMYLEPKPIESTGNIVLVIVTAVSYMLASFLTGTTVLFILMKSNTRIKEDFWNLSTLLMMGGVKLLVLSNLFT
jgi:hypothetical protein